MSKISNKIYNPKTGRYVKKDGAIGKKLLKSKSPRRKKKPQRRKKKKSPKRKKKKSPSIRKQYSGFSTKDMLPKPSKIIKTYSWFYMPLLINGMRLYDQEDIKMHLKSQKFPDIDINPERYHPLFLDLVTEFREKFDELSESKKHELLILYYDSMNGFLAHKAHHIKAKVQETLIEEVMGNEDWKVYNLATNMKMNFK